MTTLTAQQLQAQRGLDDWRVLARGAVTWFPTGSHAEGAALVRAVSRLAVEGVLDVDLRARGVRLRIDPAGDGFDESHAHRAREISAAAAALGQHADPSAMQDLELTIDAMDADRVEPFWETLLGASIDGPLRDPLRRFPSIWFEQQDAPRPLRNRIHVDVARPGAPSLEAMQEVGASIVRSNEWYATLADAEGNEADLVAVGHPADDLTAWTAMFGAQSSVVLPDADAVADLVDAVAGLADASGMPLGIDVRGDRVVLDTGKDRWEEDARFPALAAAVQQALAERGLEVDRAPLRFVQLVVDAVDIPAVRACWRALLGAIDDEREHATDIVDPAGLGIPVVFQPMEDDDEARRRQRNRIHVDLFVPAEQAEARIAAAVAAGGTIVRDAEAPDWVTIADPEGNEVDIAVAVGREERAAPSTGT